MKKKKKKSITGKVTTLLAVTVFAASFIGFTYLNFKHLNEAVSHNDTTIKQIVQINKKEGVQPELVCMVNDDYMGKKQIPVPVGDKIYYGCCHDCVSKLQNIKEYRFAQDPVTGEMVDKTEAFIALKPGSESEVLYFKSKENFSKYSQPAL